MNKLLILLLCFIQVSCVKNQKLKMIKSYTVITNNSIEPSGLTLWDGEFYTVSDKHNNIFQLQFLEDKVYLKPIIEFTQLEDSTDFEGITHDDDFFYLISENSLKILKVSRNGDYQQWLPLTNNTLEVCKQAGLCQLENAYIEGICILDNDHFLLAAERQPRGFIEIQINGDFIKAYQKNSAFFKYKKNRLPDFAGLSCADGVYVLDRNAYKVAKLDKNNNEYEESRGYSYQHIIEQSELIYKDMEFGQAEGLVVNGNYVYIILDNNRKFYKSETNGNNSLFLKLKK